MQQNLTNELSVIKEKLSAFELTHNVLNRLSDFDLTLSAKLVLVFLTTFYNAKKNGAVVFPSIQHIANTLGVGQTAVKQAIKDLILKGLILKSKLNKSGNHNKYIFTSKVQNPTVKQSENDFFKQSESDCFMYETNKKEKIKEKTNRNVVLFSKKQSVADAEVPEFIKNNKTIKNPCAYWASLSDEVKNVFLQKENAINAEKRKIEEQKRVKEQQRQAEKQQREALKNMTLSERYTKEQAIALIDAMPAEIRKISKIAKELSTLYDLDSL